MSKLTTVSQPKPTALTARTLPVFPAPLLSALPVSTSLPLHLAALSLSSLLVRCKLFATAAARQTAPFPSRALTCPKSLDVFPLG
mmetsp:Transcript_18902/g.45328  ORF Transcript_18902/g.45328 Transcript_18902/m.45328 type:complete len:85 (+) Transcript_18902:22-276(+)